MDQDYSDIIERSEYEKTKYAEKFPWEKLIGADSKELPLYRYVAMREFASLVRTEGPEDAEGTDGGEEGEEAEEG